MGSSPPAQGGISSLQTPRKGWEERIATRTHSKAALGQVRGVKGVSGAALEQHSTLPTVNRIETLGRKGTTLSRNHAEMVGTVAQEENLGQRSSEQGTPHF